MTDKTLKITFGRADEQDKAARERLRRAEAGETGAAIEQDAQFILNFEDLDDVEQLMRRSNIELVEAIVSERPESIRGAAELVDRDYKEVHRNLKELEALGVVEFETAGASKRPVLRDGAETVDFSLQFPRGADAGGSSASA